MKMRKLSPENAKYTAIILMVIGFLGFTISGLAGAYTLMLLFVIPLLAACVVDIVFWRCPHCGGHLGHWWNAYYPHCGERSDL